MAIVLDFEKPIIDIQNKIDELKKMSEASGLDMEKQIKTFEKQAEDYKKELYSKLKPSQKLQIARHPERPKFLDYVELLCDDFVELHGDREGMDDRAIIGGLGKIDGKPVMIIGIQKGRNTKENLEYNFGMPQPQGYRKALRLMQHANKFNIPIAIRKNKNLMEGILIGIGSNLQFLQTIDDKDIGNRFSKLLSTAPYTDDVREGMAHTDKVFARINASISSFGGC